MAKNESIDPNDYNKILAEHHLLPGNNFVHKVKENSFTLVDYDKEKDKAVIADQLGDEFPTTASFVDKEYSSGDYKVELSEENYYKFTAALSDFSKSQDVRFEELFEPDDNYPAGMSDFDSSFVGEKEPSVSPAPSPKIDRNQVSSQRSSLTIEEAKSIPLEDILAKYGFRPKYQNSKRLSYASPFREETKPSFFVYPGSNRFADYGESQKSFDGIDLIQRLDPSVNNFSEAMLKLSDFKGLSYSREVSNELAAKENPFDIVKVGPLENRALLNYFVNERKIDAAVAKSELKEVFFRPAGTNGKPWFSGALETDSNGLIGRNKYKKTVISGNDISSRFSGNKNLAVFEGMTDYLTFRTANKNHNEYDYLILNSTSFASRGIDKIKSSGNEYEKINGFFDFSGKTEVDVLFAESFDNYVSHKGVYIGYDDLNEWWVDQSRFRNTEKDRAAFSRDLAEHLSDLTQNSREISSFSFEKGQRLSSGDKSYSVVSVNGERVSLQDSKGKTSFAQSSDLQSALEEKRLTLVSNSKSLDNSRSR